MMKTSGQPSVARQLAAANRALAREKAKRTSLEAALRKSKEQTRTLIEQSNRLQDQMRQLSRRLLTAQEEERKRISRELHDVIAQMLTGINLRLASLNIAASVDNKKFSRTISNTQRLVEKSVARVNQFARELRPAMLDDLGLIPALKTYVKTFSQDTGIQVTFKAAVGPLTLPNAARTALYRVALEALANVARHAQATQVTIDFSHKPPRLLMNVSDNGIGFDVGDMWRKKKARHLGMLGMQERMEMAGGTLTVTSSPGHGTALQASIPLDKPKPKPTTS